MNELLAPRKNVSMPLVRPRGSMGPRLVWNPMLFRSCRKAQATALAEQQRPHPVLSDMAFAVAEKGLDCEPNFQKASIGAERPSNCAALMCAPEVLPFQCRKRRLFQGGFFRSLFCRGLRQGHRHSCLFEADSESVCALFGPTDLAAFRRLGRSMSCAV